MLVTANATTLWLTNNSDQVLSYGFTDDTTPTALGSISLGATAAVAYEPLQYLWLYSVENDEMLLANAPGDQDYGFDITAYPVVGGPSYVPIPVPEPTVAVLFMAAFTLFFATGLTGWGGSFLRTLVTGGNNE